MVSGPCVSCDPCMNGQEFHIFGSPGGQRQAFMCHMANQRMIHRLAAKAFHNVLSKKQSNYRPVILWLDDAIRRTKPDDSKEMWRLNRVVKEGNAVFLDYKF